MDFYQIFRLCSTEQDLELIRFWEVSGNDSCHGNAFKAFWSVTSRVGFLYVHECYRQVAS